MLTIRLQRVGKKNQPVFRIVLAEKKRAAQKKIVEALGIYNPRTKEFGVKEERLKYWIEKHVELSPTVHNLLVTKNLVTGKKVHAWHPKRKPTEASAEVGKTESAPSPQSSPVVKISQSETRGEEVKRETAAAPAAEAPKEEPKAEEKPAEAPAV